MEIAWQDPAVQSAIISAVGTFLSAVIAAICAAVIGKQITGRKRLQDDLHMAMNDIAFLLAVEEQHCAIHRMGSGESNKIRVRNEALSQGQTWSGQFTPSRIRRRRSQSSSG